MSLRDELIGAGVGTVIVGRGVARPGSATGVEVVVSCTERTKGSDEVRAGVASEPMVLIDRVANVWLLSSGAADRGVARVLVLADDEASVTDAQADVRDAVVAVLTALFGVAEEAEPVKPRRGRGAPVPEPDTEVVADDDVKDED